MSKSYDDYADSSFGGWPYNDRGSGKVMMPTPMGGDGVGGPQSGAKLGGVMGAKPTSGSAGLGLDRLTQPTRIQPVGGPAHVVGPNPLANGGQGPVNMIRPQPGGMPPIGPMTGNEPGGAVMDPASLGNPQPFQPRPFAPPMNAPGLLQGGAGVPQRSPGFGGIKPLSQY